MAMNTHALILEFEDALATVRAGAGYSHPPGRRKTGCARTARCAALSHGRERSLRGGVSERRAIDPISAVADGGRKHSAHPGALPFLPHIQNTSSFWGVRLILSDLYSWSEPITADNWRRLDCPIRERADDREWHHSILDRLNVRRTGTEIARRARRR